MRTLRIRLAVVSAIACAACSSAMDGPIAPPNSGVRVINATSGPLDVVVDGQMSISAVPLASISPTVQLQPGAHHLQLRAPGGATVDLDVQPTDGRVVTAAAYPGTQSEFNASVLVDTGAVVPAGKSKLRVVHLAAGVDNIEIWRSQPDFQTPVHIMTPFPYESTSPYLQSTPGAWEVFVTPAAGSAKLATTGRIAVESGERRTVVLMDSSGVLRFRVISD